VAGCDIYAENGEVQLSFELAIANVLAIVAVAPFVDSDVTAEFICA
jgi:hypothetical protein